MKAIVVGSGGREHAIAWALAKSPLIEEVIVAPGNGGTQTENKCRNTTLSPLDAAVHERCALAVIGPEVPLAEGLADKFWAIGIPCVGANAKAAQLEASKDYAKLFMKKYGVASPASETFTDSTKAKAYIKAHGAPIVIKADGLAAGKGVTVAATVEDAVAAVDDIMLSPRLGDAGHTVVIEDYLEGVEMSVLALVSVMPGRHGVIVPLLPARDHKRLMDGAQGPNTGGMGAVCPLSDVRSQTMSAFENDILRPTLRGLEEEGYDYRGFIFFGVMNTPSGPKLLEYNVRLGDPETQAVLPLLESDFAKVCGAIINGTLDTYQNGGLKWKDGYVVSPCVVSGGYPGHYEKGKRITFTGSISPNGQLTGHGGENDMDCVHNEASGGTKIFIAGAEYRDGSLVTTGGRVLCCSAWGKTPDDARDAAYKAVDEVHFDGAFHRTDIGMPGAASSGRLK